MRHSVFWRLWGHRHSRASWRCQPPQREPAAFPHAGPPALDRFKDAAGVGMGVGEVAEGNTGLRDIVKNFFSG